MIPGMVISSTSTVLISIQAVSAPLICGLAAGAALGATGAGPACATTVRSGAVAAAAAASLAVVCAGASAACTHSVNANVAAHAARISGRIAFPSLVALVEAHSFSTRGCQLGITSRVPTLSAIGYLTRDGLGELYALK